MEDGMEIDTTKIDSRYDLPGKDDRLVEEAKVPLSAREEYLVNCAMKRMVDLLQRAGRI
jgi:hypothetical protein